MNNFFEVEKISISRNVLFLIAGPCVIEGEQFTLALAEKIKLLSAELEIPFIFKASFDKANRSSIHSCRGPGLAAGLKVLKKIKQELDVPVISDIHEPWQAEEVADVLSVIQIPAFLCRQTDLLLAAGSTGLPVNIKKGQFVAPQDMALTVEKVRAGGSERILLTERGTFFGYRNLVVDFRGIPIMKDLGCPVVMDATHSVQQPTAQKSESGGQPEYIPLMAAAGVTCGANGIFLEVHPNPAQAHSDSANSLDLEKLPQLLMKLKRIYNC